MISHNNGRSFFAVLTYLFCVFFLLARMLSNLDPPSYTTTYTLSLFPLMTRDRRRVLDLRERQPSLVLSFIWLFGRT